MVNIVSVNFHKPQEYKYYHIRVLNGDKKVFDSFNLSIDDVINKIKQIDKGCNFVVIGTVEDIDACLNYMNNYQNQGIVFVVTKEDIFNSKSTIFVNCTNYFKNIKI
ncbi:MAG: hypothetical protein VZQ61_04715 [Christensenellaceae bacterium]